MSHVILVVPTELTITGRLSQEFLNFCTDRIDPAVMVSLVGVCYGVVWRDAAGLWELYYLNAQSGDQSFAPTRRRAAGLESHLFAELPHELFLLIDPSIKEIVVQLLEDYCGHSVEVVTIPGPVSTSYEAEE